MSLVEEALHTRLLAVAGVTALIGDRVHPVPLPQNVTYPAVSYQLISRNRETAFGVDPLLATSRIQVNAWASTYTAVKALAEQIRLALERFRGTVLGIEWQDTLLDGETDLYDDTVLVHQVAIDAIVFHREASS